MEELNSPANQISNKTIDKLTGKTCVQKQISPVALSNVSPISSGSATSKVGSLTTPGSFSSQSSAIHTPSPAQSGKIMFTPLSRRTNSKRKENQPVCKSSSVALYNPFEKAADALQLPTVSPSLFREVVSPSVKEDEKFSWTIDQLAVLRPSNIETSPFPQFDIPIDPEYERRAQEAIDMFFNNTSVVPSPWTNQSQSTNAMSEIWATHALRTPASASASPMLPGENPELVKNSTWSQTVLSLPPILPLELEQALAPFCNFNQDQAIHMPEESDEAVNLNNTTLRRKLLFNQAERISPTLPKLKETMDALPLEDEDTVQPWGVSMIRPSSRMTLSPPGKERCSSPFCNPPGSHHSTSPLGSVSPIRRFSPSEFRTLHSPNSDDSTPVDRQLSSPDLSPIRCSDHNDYSTPLSIDPYFSLGGDALPPFPMGSSFTTGIPPSVMEAAHADCGSPNSSLLQVHHGSSGSRSLSALSGNCSVQNEKPLVKIDVNTLVNSCGERRSEIGTDFDIHDGCYCEDDDVDSLDGDSIISPTSSMMMTPQIGHTKPSPQFSSSPIRGIETSRLSTEVLKCSPEFSSSQISPISWMSEHVNYRQESAVILDRLSHEKRYQESNIGEGDSMFQTSVTASDGPLSHQSLESSASGDTGNTQETGYHSGSSSLQLTNPCSSGTFHHGY